MPRIALGLCLVAVSLVSGCANFIETRTIAQFTAALESQDLDLLKKKSSDAFEQKALRLTESIEDFKIVNLPKGKRSVVKVVEVDDSERRVTV